jgi:O-antigen ligase
MNFLSKKGNEITFLVLQAIILSALTLTLSRSSYVSFIGAVLLYVWFRKSWKILIGIVVFIGILFCVSLPQKNITPIFRVETGVSRVTNWAESLELIKKAPVFGNGFNLLRSIQEPDYGKKDTEQISHASGGVDNSFLFVLATTGIIGGVAWVYLLFSMWKLGRKNITYVLSLVAIVIHSLFVNSMFYPWIMIWMWILTGAVEKNRKK